MKKTLNQLKASRRNLSLMLLAGMITNLKHIKHFCQRHRSSNKNRYTINSYRKTSIFN